MHQRSGFAVVTGRLGCTTSTAGRSIITGSSTFGRVTSVRFKTGSVFSVNLSCFCIALGCAAVGLSVGFDDQMPENLVKRPWLFDGI